MAPDRGHDRSGFDRLSTTDDDVQGDDALSSRQNPVEEHAIQDDQDDQVDQDGSASTPALRVAKPGLDVQGRSFTPRAIAAGLLVGLVICFSNMYFGLQTGWVSMMTMPASLMGFGIFKTLSRHLSFPFSPVENVLVQTVAGSMAIMPLGCGFVGVLPAMQYLLKPEEQGPVNLGTWKLVVWSLGLCYFGVVFAVPLRRQVIIREKLRFPSGFSTAVLISVLHGKTGLVRDDSSPKQNHHHHVVPDGFGGRLEHDGPGQPVDEEQGAERQRQQWKANVRLLLACFLVSGLYTFATYFFPVLRDLPIFGVTAASTWLWTLNPSLAYVGQGIIMGPATTIHMLLGAILGWGILSPLAKHRGWAPGKISDWENGSKGWIVWTSLAIMLADAVVSLGHLASRPLLRRLSKAGASFHERWQNGNTSLNQLLTTRHQGYTTLGPQEEDDMPPPSPSSNPQQPRREDEEEEQQQQSVSHLLAEADQDDAPASQLISNRTVVIGLVLSIAFCVLCIHIVFGDLVPLYATVSAVLMALVLSIMGVRALGETDLNPVSGISKLAQLFFALIVPQSHPTSVLINLVAGAVSEAGALQAGDLMQDLKTGHLLGAAPKAQFWGQVVGATVGAVVSAFIYRLYTAVYTIPGSLFQVPTAYVWIFTARLVTGQGLPYMAREWAIAFAALFTLTTMVRIYATNKRWQHLIPGGIAVAVGMYNVPSFTLARTVGGLVAWWWRRKGTREDTPLIVLASGFILGEGFLSIVNLMMESVGVPHL
ncbi:OPT oligopeptide transporter [Diaporthe helianthi]|uniref:OPT oligopeptide transporter n=1 Tax=Diaporthe helianthi TaxID=158607 RepID=A0A2P5I4R5_DIAHE|nr:OPT oligopeptide transporter [Diaporthe helianthi]